MKKVFIFIFSLCAIGSSAQTIEKLTNASVNSYFEHFVNSGGKMFFEGDEGIHSWELWVTDGTAAGTHLVKDINQSISQSSNIGDLIDYHNKLYFRADDSIHGIELWVSDGTLAGTHIVKDINADTLDSYPRGLIICNDTLFFAANDTEVWKTDGTTLGTKRVKKVPQSHIRNFGVFNNKLYFRGTLGGLWVSDGTTAGTQMVYENAADHFSIEDYYDEHPYRVYNNKIYFSATTNSMGSELWQSDGTNSGTNVLKDVESWSSNGCDPFFGNIFHDTLYFFGWATGADDRAIIKSDGTEIGTNIFGDFGTMGIGSSLLGGFVEYQNNLYFSGRDDWDIGGEPYFTDGTVSGTHLLKDIDTSWDNQDSDPHAFTVFHNKLYFIATDSGFYDSDLWVTDGTTAGTIKLIPAGAIYTDALSGNYYGFNEFNNALYFMASYDNSGTNIWRIVNGALETENILKADQQINIYPNPATNQLTVESVGSNQYAVNRIEITNSLGVRVYAESVNLKSKIINLKSFASGIYFIKVYFGDGGMEVKKFVKE